MLINWIKEKLFHHKYILISNHVKGIDKRCKKSKNSYIGINNLNPEQIRKLFEEAYDLNVPADKIREIVKRLDAKGFSNRMINVNIFVYGKEFKEGKEIGTIITANNFREGIHHMVPFDYIDTEVVNQKIVIKK